MQNILKSGLAVFTALLASTCCVGPLLAIVGLMGVSASTLTWLISIKPLLIGSSLMLTIYNLYKAYFPNKKESCCTSNIEYEELALSEKRAFHFFQSKRFLWGIAFLNIFILILPYLNLI
ncbi:hypothetical protein [Flammeovirga agarivorans]|uniref:Mercuric transport protein MerT n=1 Tax=Flammeovirga agarivorans TaxID=2726742 RepID=A0A7X8XV74_9BACT|nr:hypothetical protein [Flammeovirga agarivorans]NLR90815.1 hypothetical protein [Flammeovirga agarivorans]